MEAQITALMFSKIIDGEPGVRVRPILWCSANALLITGIERRQRLDSLRRLGDLPFSICAPLLDRGVAFSWPSPRLLQCGYHDMPSIASILF